MIAGLEQVTGGRILIGDRDVTRLPPQERDVAMVFQSYALYPHMTVRDNLAFGLTIRKQPKALVAQRVEAVAESLGLSPLLDRKPAQLSGGQRQRVALGRAIVREPQAFLFDEPLSNLDAQLRAETRAELGRLHRRLGATMVYVTHDQIEAMTLGTRVAVLKDGLLQQIAPPLELYRRPANRFVAGFIGSPAMNFLSGALVHAVLPELRHDGDSLVAGIRPQDVTLDDRPPAEGNLRGTVWLVEPLGSEQLVHMTVGDARDVVAIAPADLAVRADDVVSLRIAPDAVHLFDATSGARVERSRAGAALAHSS
jgi:multiple sugar transport system ATP-binding protein